MSAAKSRHLRIVTPEDDVEREIRENNVKAVEDALDALRDALPGPEHVTVLINTLLAVTSWGWSGHGTVKRWAKNQGLL